jgi:F-type H+-transporting ATPase subunit b
MLLEINPLVLPDIGLVFWNTIAFLVLLIVLGKFAWKPMLKAISDRENVIVDAVQNALNEIARRGYLTTYAGALPA